MGSSVELVLETGPWVLEVPSQGTMGQPDSLSAPPSLWLGTRLEEKTLSVGTSSLGKFLSVSPCL